MKGNPDRNVSDAAETDISNVKHQRMVKGVCIFALAIIANYWVSAGCTGPFRYIVNRAVPCSYTHTSCSSASAPL